MDRIRRTLNSVGGRFATGLVLVLSIIVGLYPDHPRPFDLDKFAFIAASAITWIFAELSGFATSSGHDVDLYRHIFELAGDKERRFLKDQDFLAAFDNDRRAGIWTLAMYDGAAYQFNDKKIQKNWKSIKEQIESFAKLIAAYTGPIGASPTFMSVHPDRSDRENPEPWVERHAKELNDAATKLYNDLERFLVYGRKRLLL